MATLARPTAQRIRYRRTFNTLRVSIRIYISNLFHVNSYFHFTRATPSREIGNLLIEMRRRLPAQGFTYLSRKNVPPVAVTWQYYLVLRCVTFGSCSFRWLLLISHDRRVCLNIEYSGRTKIHFLRSFLNKRDTSFSPFVDVKRVWTECAAFRWARSVPFPRRAITLGFARASESHGTSRKPTFFVCKYTLLY